MRYPLCAPDIMWSFLLNSVPSSKKRSAPPSPAGNKYAIRPKDENVTWLAGLYRMEGPFPYFTVLTRQPEGAVSAIHDRMPVILKTSRISEWINPMTDLLRVKEMAWGSLTDMTIAEREESSQTALP